MSDMPTKAPLEQPKQPARMPEKLPESIIEFMLLAASLECEVSFRSDVINKPSLVITFRRVSPSTGKCYGLSAAFDNGQIGMLDTALQAKNDWLLSRLCRMLDTVLRHTE